MLVEREEFLASLRRHLSEALNLDGSGRLVFLGGEAGIGKTALAAALAEFARADASGAEVRRGACDNITTAEALGPILDALPELAAAAGLEEGTSRLRLFRQVRGMLSGAPMVLELEDVHWADEATLDILRFLGRRLAGTRLLILATFRSEEVGADHRLTVVMGELAASPDVIRMQLPALSRSGVRQLLDDANSALDAGEVFQRTGGNPFYVTEVLAAGSEHVPATVRDAVLARVAWLSPAARDVVAAASVLGRPAEPDFLAQVAAQPLSAVDECLSRGVLVAHDGALLDQLSYECYLTDQMSQARASALEALAIYEQEQGGLSIGRAQRWLSRLSWMLGQNADSERYAAAAVATLEPLDPGHELAMAYSNLAQLRMLGDDAAAAERWGMKAIELARRLGDRDTETHALNNVGTALLQQGDMIEGRARLTQSLDLAIADDAHEHAARAYTNLGSVHLSLRSFQEADRVLEAGIAYCTDRDLDTWRLYMSARLAHSLAEQGRYAAAEQRVADILRHPHLAPITQVCALPVGGVLAARRGADAKMLDDAVPIAVATGEPQRLVPVATARAEAAWIAGRAADIPAEIDRAWPVAITHPQPWNLGELCWWLHLAGDRRQFPASVARPFALMLAGSHRLAASEWRDLSCPLWSAYALAFSPEMRDAQECLAILDRLGASAVRDAVLRTRHAQGLTVPRGPRPASRANPAGLTPREVEVLGLLAEGLSNAEVAQRLFLSEKTVGHHVSAVLRKLSEPTRSRAVATALRLGIIAHI